MGARPAWFPSLHLGIYGLGHAFLRPRSAPAFLVLAVLAAAGAAGLASIVMNPTPEGGGLPWRWQGKLHDQAAPGLGVRAPGEDDAEGGRPGRRRAADRPVQFPRRAAARAVRRVLMERRERRSSPRLKPGDSAPRDVLMVGGMGGDDRARDGWVLCCHRHGPGP